MIPAPESPLDDEIAKKEKVVADLRAELDALDREFEARERKAARLSNLNAEEERLREKIRRAKGEEPPFEDPSEP